MGVKVRSYVLVEMVVGACGVKKEGIWMAADDRTCVEMEVVTSANLLCLVFATSHTEERLLGV